MDENSITVTGNIFAILRLQQQEQTRLLAENQELRARINRLEEMVARVEAKLEGGAV